MRINVIVILDAVAAVAPYAFVLPFLWIAAAYLVAAIRVRHTLPRRRIFSLVGTALVYPISSVYAIMLLGSVRYFNDLPWWVVWCAFIILYPPLLVVPRLTDRGKIGPIWQQLGYARLIDFVLFRPLSIDLPLEIGNLLPETSSIRHPNRSTYLLMLGISIVGACLSMIGISLQPCEWLDIATGRSGCLRALPFDNGSSYGEIAVSPDGQFMAVGRWKEPLRLYRVADGNLLHELPDLQLDCGRSVSFSPDNRWVATISKDGVVSISDVQTGDLVHSLPAITSTQGIKFSPDGKYLAVSLAQSSLQFWRTTDWTVHLVIPAPVYSISFSADGRWLAGETAGERVGIWDMADGTVYRTVPGRIVHAALSPDGTQLAITSYGSIKIWNMSDEQLIRTIPAEARPDLAYSPDGQYLVASESFAPVMSYIHQISFWRASDGQRVATLPASNFVGCAAFAANSDVFAYSDWQSLKIFRLRRY